MNYNETLKETKMTDILSKLNTIIAEQLPAVTAGELKKYLESAEQNKKTLESKTLELERCLEASKLYQKERDELEARLLSLSDKEKHLEEKEKRLQEQELKIETRTRNFELEFANVKINSLERERMTVIDLVQKVFGHPGVTIKRDTSKGVSAYNQGGGYWQHTTDLESETESRTESKT